MRRAGARSLVLVGAVPALFVPTLAPAAPVLVDTVLATVGATTVTAAAVALPLVAAALLQLPGTDTRSMGIATATTKGSAGAEPFCQVV